MDLSKTPLKEAQIAQLAIVGAGLYHDKETGHTYVSKRYWNGINENTRAALVRLVSNV